jgi:hypothetical protein
MDPTKHNYYSKLVKLREQGKLPAGSLNEVDIAHDDWCAIYGGGYCNCDPDITLKARSTEAIRSSGPNHLGEDTRPLEPPTEPCPHCGNKEFLIWQKPTDPKCQAISCNRCGAVLFSTYPLDEDDRPLRRT